VTTLGRGEALRLSVSRPELRLDAETRHDGAVATVSTLSADQFGRGIDLAGLVARSGVPAATLHYWRQLGLLPPATRVAANRFVYDERHVQAARLVRLLREQRRMPLRDIAAVLPTLLAAPTQEALQPQMWDAVIAAQVPHLEPAAPPAELVAAAREVFAERGYAFVSVDDLCAAAGIAKGSFYRWYASKDDAYVAAIRSIGERTEASLGAQPADVGLVDAERALGAAMLPYLALLLEAGSRTMQGEAAVGEALIAALNAMERAFARLAGTRRASSSRRRLEDVLARVVSAAIEARTEDP
jgi:AcrR family transcriptional regulator